MSETDLKIVQELLRSLSLLGAKSDLLGTVGSWKDTLKDEDVLVSVRVWNEAKAEELKERLSLASAND
jgi:hypothetical protein